MRHVEESFAERIMRRISGVATIDPSTRNISATLEKQLDRAEKTGVLSLANGKLKEVPDIFTVELRSLDLNHNLLKFL
jgi:hypothetical protein